jgi:hypothetical protein
MHSLSYILAAVTVFLCRIRQQTAQETEGTIQERLGVLAATRTVRMHLPLCVSAIHRFSL